MRHDQFVGQLQHRAGLASRGDAEKVIRCTLETLADRIDPVIAAHLADQLPPEIGLHLRDGAPKCRLDLEEFFEVVASREAASALTAREHSEEVLSLVTEVVSPGIIGKLVRQLPVEYAPLFATQPRNVQLSVDDRGEARFVGSFHIEDFGERF
jgi:uncharacterized protein (DUF2267 family)